MVLLKQVQAFTTYAKYIADDRERALDSIDGPTEEVSECVAYCIPRVGRPAPDIFDIH
jgi:hypothetical protein